MRLVGLFQWVLRADLRKAACLHGADPESLCRSQSGQDVQTLGIYS